VVGVGVEEAVGCGGDGERGVHGGGERGGGAAGGGRRRRPAVVGEEEAELEQQVEGAACEEQVVGDWLACHV